MKNSALDGGRNEVLRKWHDLLGRHRLQSCYNIASEQVMETNTECWADVREMIENMAPREYVEALNEIDNLMRQNS